MVSFTGLIFAFFTAIFKSSSEILSKYSLLEEVDEYMLAWALRFFAIPPIIIGLLVFGIPEINYTLFFAISFSVPAGVLATVFYMKAIKSSDLSLISPISGISPVLVLLSSSLIVGEFPSALGLIGVMTTTVGIYILKVHEASSGLSKPFKAIWREPGSKFMISMLLIYAVTAPVDKIGVEASSPIFYTLVLHIGQLALLTPIMIYNNSDWKESILRNKKEIIAIGGLSGISSIAQMTALTFTLVVYVISIKRAGILLSV
ncbi:MAG: EamA family transporter, partial [Candidatus Nanohaloarchaea archaeon]